MAARLLEQSGYKIIARNWRPGNALRGEVDCIAWDETRCEAQNENAPRRSSQSPTRQTRVLCFVEVKARRAPAGGKECSAPQEAVNFSKQRQLSRLANAFVSLHNLGDVPCRFDVVEVWLGATEKEHRLRLCRNAFDYRGD